MEMLKPIKRSKIRFNLEDSNITSKLPKEVKALVKDLADVAMYVKAYKEIGVDEDVVPFGRIKKEVVLDAKKILDQLTIKVKEKNSKQEFMLGDDKEDNSKAVKRQQELQSLMEQISRLSSEYYQLLPKVSPKIFHMYCRIFIIIYIYKCCIANINNNFYNRETTSM